MLYYSLLLSNLTLFQLKKQSLPSLLLLPKQPIPLLTPKILLLLRIFYYLLLKQIIKFIYTHFWGFFFLPYFWGGGGKGVAGVTHIPSQRKVVESSNFACG